MYGCTNAATQTKYLKGTIVMVLLVCFELVFTHQEFLDKQCRLVLHSKTWACPIQFWDGQPGV